MTSRETDIRHLIHCAAAALALALCGATTTRAASITFSQDTDYANPGSGSILVNGTGVNSLTVPSDTTFTNDAQPVAGSYFYQWSGDKITPGNRVSDPLLLAAQSTDVINITFIFSLPPTGCTNCPYGDLDDDQLSDRWEDLYGLDATTALPPNGTFANGDSDTIPTEETIFANAWPLTGSRLAEGGYNSSTRNAAFHALLEFSGLDGTASNPSNFSLNAVNRGDDPRTSPTVADTDNDSMPDGWEYYFWRWRGAGATNAIVGGGTNVTGSAFDPARPGNPGGDADGDQLSNLGEFTAGTDPTHCDTDRDGMDDKWELDNGLNPLTPGDRDSNPDNDRMASNSVTYTYFNTTNHFSRRHSAVYLAGANTTEAGDTGFDPRTAWDGGTIAHPDTKNYTGLDEYLGADLLARVQYNVDGIATNVFDPGDQTNPNNADTDGDGMPDGWECYVGLNPNGDGDKFGNVDDDGVDNHVEWANLTASVSNNAGSITNWTRKLWPTDPGFLDRPFGWQNVWFDANTNGLYDAGETNIYWGGFYLNATGLYPHSAGFTTPVGTLGAINPRIASVVVPNPDYPILYDAASTPPLAAAVWVDVVADGNFVAADDFLLPTGGLVPADGTVGTAAGLLFYHNDAHPSDTDWDGSPDSTPTGGGEKGGDMNPTSVDTDGDFLPDGWEVYAYDFGVPTNGGVLVSDKGADHDGDGLPNELEYWTGTVYEWMHIDPFWDDFPGRIVTRRVAEWDLGGDGSGAALRDDLPFILPPDFATDPSFNVSRNQRARTAGGSADSHTARADNFDTDFDGMDDYWEVYHGLNPTKGSYDFMAPPLPNSNGDRGINTGSSSAPSDADPSTTGYAEIGLVTSPFANVSAMLTSLAAGQYNVHLGPFNLGLRSMDADGDGQANLNEYSQENYTPAGRSFHHTDPTAWLRTYRHIGLSGSFVTFNYTFDNYPPTSTPGFRSELGWDDDAGWPFRFETCEGFDTDNDLVRDTDEITGQSSPGASGGSDPLDGREPIRNRALILNATRGDFLREANPVASATPSLLERFTVEAWVRPSATTGDVRIVIDRSFAYDSAILPGVPVPLANFRMGITNNGRPFVLFENDSGLLFPAVGGLSSTLAPNQWAHLAATYNGTNLILYVNGVLAASTPAAGIPVNGYDPNSAFQSIPGNIMVGARDINPLTVSDNIFNGVDLLGTNYFVWATNFFGGYIDEVRVWNGPRTQAEIQNNMRTKLSRTATGLSSSLEHYYTFDDCPDVDVNWTVGGIAMPDEPVIPGGFELATAVFSPQHQTILNWFLFSQRSTVYTGTFFAPYNYIIFAEDHVAHKAVEAATDDILHATNIGTSVYGPSYKNSANPYERRANLIRNNIDRPNIDLLFCRGAQVDGDIFTVDSWLPGLGTDPDQSDTDGDGLPDNWESFYGLNPFSGSGDDGTYGDMDNDGLNNLAEFRAGTDPSSYDSNGDGLSDYDGTNSLGQTFGELFADGDGMDDAWEAQFPGSLSPLTFDAFDDDDSDGWSNFAEFMYNGPSATGTVCRTNPTDPNSYPTPNIGFQIKYKGTSRSGTLHIRAYNHPSMNFDPTAEYNATPPSFGNLLNLTVSQFEGALREGDTWFFAWFDNDSDGAWSDGEPAGIGQAQPYRVSFGDLTNVVIGLTDTLPGYARFAWPALASQVYTVVITRTTSSGAPIVLNRIPLIGRNYFNEGDYHYAGSLGLDAGDSDLPGYQWFAGGSSGSFSFDWSAGLTKPIVQSPNGGNLIFAQSTLAWTMDDNSVSLRLQILANSATGTVIYDNADIPAPYKDADGVYRLTLPLYVGDLDLPDGTYFWRIQSANPRKQSSFSDFASFTINTTNSFPDSYSIEGTVHYFGRVTKGDVIVQAYRSPGYSGFAAAQVTLTNAVSGAYRITGLPAGSYYLRAFLDQNKNGRLDTFEAVGTITDLANTSCEGLQLANTVPVNQTGQDIVVRDRDTNGDHISDAFAYQYLSKQFQRADFDGDSLGDIAVYFAGNGTWYIRKSTDQSLQQTQFGWTEAVPVPGDYDGDGRRDIAVYHPASATWYLSRSTAGFQERQFGWSAVTPVPGDYDGDGLRDIAVYDPGSGTWYILQSSTLSVRIQQFGFGGVTPVPGDYDGDGKADLAVYHQPSGNWYILHSSSQQLFIHNWGWFAAKPVPCDYDGDGKTDMGVYHQAAGDWFISYSLGGSSSQNWGWSQARPVPADYEDDGRADIAVYYPPTGNWYILYSSGGSATIPWGWNATVPVSSDAGLMNGRTP